MLGAVRRILKSKTMSVDQGNQEWQAYLSEFAEIIKGKQPKDVAKKLETLKESANASETLTGRQKEGIVSRCDNFVSGNYGAKTRG